MAVCEDLATKAELQELRDQINALLGEKEGGGGQIDVLQAGTLEGTTTGSLLAVAATAVVGFTVKNLGSGNFIEAIASGAATFEAVKANGTTKIVDGFKKAVTGISKNTGGIKAAAGGVAANAAALVPVASLALGLGNSLLQIGTLKLIEMNANEYRQGFNYLARDYSNLMGFVSQQRDSIEEAQSVNEANKQTIEEQKNINDIQFQQLIDAQQNIDDLATNNRELVNEIEKANTTVAAYRAQVEAIEDDVDGFKQDLLNQVASLETALTETEGTNSKQDETIAGLSDALDVQRLTTIEHGIQLERLDLQMILWREEFVDLKEFLGLNPESVDLTNKSWDLITIYEADKVKKSVSGGGTATAVSAATAAQQGALELASSLTGVAQQVPTLTNDDTYNQTGVFDSTLADYISQIETGGTVDEQQLTDLREGIKIDFESLLPLALGATVVPALDVVRNQTTPAAIQGATSTAVCNATAPGGCIANNVTNPLGNQIGQMINAGGTAFSAANFAILNAMQPVLNGVSSTLTTVKSITNSTLGVVTHATHGLEAVQNFASTAWKATKADKILGAVNTALLVHNGMMLSNNLAGTISEALNLSLEALGIRDETDTPIDIGKAIGDKVEALLTKLIGSANYTALTTRIAKANRIYQAGVNVLQTTQELFDSARTITELAAQNTGQIGNALLEAGVVYEDAYREMLDEVNETTTAMHKLDKFRAGIRTAEEGVSLITEVSSEIIDIQENMQQLREDKAAWREEIEATLQEKETETAETKIASTVATDVNDLDFERDDSNQ